MFQLWCPSVRDVLKRVGGVDREAEENHMGVGVGQWPQPVVIVESEQLVCGNVYDDYYDYDDDGGRFDSCHSPPAPQCPTSPTPP